MNLDDAASLISLHRDGRVAEGRVQKALRYAEGHDTLRLKLSVQMEFDSRLADVIHSIKPPENLRQKLRAAGAQPEAGRKRVPLLSPAVLTAVCGILLIIGFCVWTFLERLEKFPGRENVERMLSQTSRGATELEVVATTTGALGDWFYMRGFEGYALPPEMGALPVVGSGVLRLDGHPIAQLAIDRQHSILYVFRTADFGVGLPADEPWKELDHEGWAAGLRCHGTLCYLLAMRGTREDLQAFLAALKK